MARLSEIYKENRLVVLKLIFFSILMVLVPLVVFAIVYFCTNSDHGSALSKSGISAVVAVNVVILLYVVMAWREDAKRE